MTLRTLVTVGIVSVILSACHPPAPSPTPEEMAHDAWMHTNAKRDVTCQGHEDCAIKWDRAVEWVYKNSSFKIRTVSHHIIDTYGPVPYLPYYRFTIIKKALGKGKYALNLIIYCHDESCAKTYITQSSYISAVMDGKE